MKNSISIWSATATSKLKMWRQLRDTITAIPLDQAIDTTVSWWRTTPAVRRTFDPWKIDTWPNPWILLYQSDQCHNSAVLGMYYTLRLSGADMSAIQIVIVNDNEYKHTCLALLVDKTQVILYNKTVSMKSENSLEILNTFTSADLDALL